MEMSDGSVSEAIRDGRAQVGQPATPDIERLKRLAEAAYCPGPWHTYAGDGDGVGDRDEVYIGGGDKHGPYHVAEADVAADAAFIAAASPDVLLALLGALQVAESDKKLLVEANEMLQRDSIRMRIALGKESDDSC